jgi:hypothetical protein
VARRREPVVWKPKKAPSARKSAWRGSREVAKFGRCELEIVSFTPSEQARYAGQMYAAPMQERGMYREQQGSHFWSVRHRGGIRRGGSNNGIVQSAAEGKERAIDAASTFAACGRSGAGLAGRRRRKR